MVPYHKDYYIEKIKEYNNEIKPGVNGSFSIGYTEKDYSFDGYLYENKEVIEEKVVELKEGDKLWMRISPHEVQGCFESIKRAKGRVGVVGLGLGYFTQEVLKKSEVTEVIVYEISNEIIELYKKNFGEHKKLNIVAGDAFNAYKQEFDFFFVDIYEYELRPQVVDDYVKFNNLHNIKEYSFWGLEHFLLSCPIDKIVWVYIPEEWMDMARDLYDRFNEAGYVKYFSPVDEELAIEILEKFKGVFN